MSAINDGGPAFPCPVEFDPNNQLVSHGSFGMTLRDYFAGQALVGMSAHKDSSKWEMHEITADAYAYADAMIAARKGGAK